MYPIEHLLALLSRVRTFFIGSTSNQSSPSFARMQNQLLGIHHVTAITGDAQRNLDFYSGVLGLRLVKRTVNFDDPSSYHLYYGDLAGSPGSLVTFFAWPGAKPGRAGTGEAVALTFEISERSLDWWRERLHSFRVAVTEEHRFGSRLLSFADPDGMRLELVGTAGPHDFRHWPHSGIAKDHAISRIHGVTLSVVSVDTSVPLYTQTLGFTNAIEQPERARFTVGTSFVDVVSNASARGQMGSGTIHHVAFRAPDDASQSEWRSKLTQHAVGVSPVMDRKYFHSIYFREPNRVLFEIATDGPGFAVDEPLEHLGESLMLPAGYEIQRPRLEQMLPQLTLPRVEPATA
ncbi:MAG: ring-cleaving dioxygenase [Acidobacteriaceae bacterium]|nr:ring-cleaving dioxygenase [Acidobacteriaceae bacterium]